MSLEVHRPGAKGLAVACRALGRGRRQAAAVLELLAEPSLTHSFPPNAGLTFEQIAQRVERDEVWVASLFYGQVRCFSSSPESSDVPQQDWPSFASLLTALTFLSLVSYQAKPTEVEVKKLGKVLGLQEGVRPLPRLLKRAAASLTLCLFSPRPSSIPRIPLPLLPFADNSTTLSPCSSTSTPTGSPSAAT